MPQILLRTHSPSPSTTSYTVSDKPRRASPVPSILHVLNLSARVIIATCAVVLFATQLKLLSRFFGAVGIESRVGTPLTTVLGPSYSKDGARWWMPLMLAAAVFWACSRRSSVEESLLIIRGLGIQTSSSSSSYLSTPTTRFIPTAQIQDIFIHEAFIGFSVKFYLAVIVEGEEEAVVVFPKLLPRREVLEDVWRGAGGVLGWSKG